MRIGLTFPESFGAMGALQPAISTDQAEEWTEIARQALAKNPGLSLRLLTSSEDYYRAAVRRIGPVTWKISE